MHDPRVGRFFAVDPLAHQYHYNSPYAFSENDVISHVELEGLEKGEIKISDEKAKLATLNWKKIYTATTDGKGAITSEHKKIIKESGFKSDFLAPYREKTIFINKLPVTENSDGTLSRGKVELSTRSEWRKGNAWKLVVDYDIKIIVPEVGTTRAKIYKGMNADLALYGIIQSESGASIDLKFPSMAAGTVGNSPTVKDKMFLNDDLGKVGNKVTTEKYNITEGGLFAHEVGHNFGVHHAKGDYSQKGIMSNQANKLPLTKENNLEIINDNLDSIELKKETK